MGKKKKSERREEILDAAASLLEEEGGFTLEALASRVGLSKVTLYRYFAGKGALLEALEAEREVDVDVEGKGDTRQQILDAAQKEFFALGIGRTTMEDIAQRAGVGVATVYRHFGTKEGLLQGFAESLGPSRVGAATFLEEFDLEEGLAAFARLAIESLQEKQELLPLMLESRRHFPDLFEKLIHRPHRTSKLLEEFFRVRMERGELEGYAPWDLAVAFRGMVISFGWFVPFLEGMEEPDTERLGVLLARLFLYGAASKKLREQGCEGANKAKGAGCEGANKAQGAGR